MGLKPEPPVATPIPAPGLTQRQVTDLAGPGGVPPGIYHLRNVQSGQCLWFMPSNAPFRGEVLPGLPEERSYLIQHHCPSGGITSVQSEFYVLPHPSGGFTFRTKADGDAGIYGLTAGQIPTCVTIARQVLIGTPRMDFHRCYLPAGQSSWSMVGEGDQRFILQSFNGGRFAIMTLGGDCWALRDGSSDLGNWVMKWRCTGGADQLYSFELIRPFSPETERDLLRADSWYPTSTGHRWIRGAAGVSLRGTPYTQFDTANDNGAYCAKRCAELDKCRGWTWMGPGFVTNSADPPRCQWYDAPQSAENRGDAYMVKLRSGIVR